ncbi:MAG: four helix bundle protein [Bacteroidia bacterium]|nr:four helix bundle protein [Bacteroidia bacterium]
MIGEYRNNVIVDKSFSFALKIVAACELLDEHRKYVISNQLLKSGTSIGASVREAQFSHFPISQFPNFHIRSIILIAISISNPLL